MKYISLPSKETEHDPRLTSVNEAGELTDPQWNPDSPNSDNEFEHDNSEEEQDMLSKERGEDDTIIGIEENIDDMDYSKPDVSLLFKKL